MHKRRTKRALTISFWTYLLSYFDIPNINNGINVKTWFPGLMKLISDHQMSEWQMIVSESYLTFPLLLHLVLLEFIPTQQEQCLVSLNLYIWHCVRTKKQSGTQSPVKILIRNQWRSMVLILNLNYQKLNFISIHPHMQHCNNFNYFI